MKISTGRNWRITIIFFLFFTSSISRAQNNYELKIVLTDSTSEAPGFVKKYFDEKKKFSDSLEIRDQIETAINQLHGEGYLTCGLDSISKVGFITTAYIFVGGKYLMATLKQGNVPSELLQGTGYQKKMFSDKPFNYQKISQINSKILRNCENNGYPFAILSLDSVSYSDDHFIVSLNLTRNSFLHIDSIIIKGNPDVAPVYLHNYIGISPGDIYNESQIKKISARLHELAFVKEVRTSQVLFTEKETKLYLFLEHKPASQFDGVIGLLPDESKAGKYNLTGDVHLKLQNSLRRGEVIELNWKQFPVKSQDLKLHLLYPFLFNTPFGIDGYLSIFKNDSIYVDVIKNLGVQYSFYGNNYLKAFINDKESDLQSTEGLENITTLPPYADITTVSYGATLHYEKLDYRLNPRQGLFLETTASTGNRKIRKNSEINPEVYDSIKLNSVTFQAEVITDYYISLGGRHVLNPGLMFGYIHNDDLFTNELYRIGGLKSLRGFDEESIYASSYTIGKIEYRYLLEQNSFLFTFFNMAYYENSANNNLIHDNPYGFGAGIDFETKIGIMSVSYALGKQFDNPVLFKNGKIHFGIVNYF